jgi:hypothetical protein
MPQSLSVPNQGGSPPSLGVYLSLLASKVQHLVDADPRAARRALELSQEAAPDLWAIAEQSPTSQWGQALVASDQLHSLLPQPWSGQKMPEPDPLPNLEQVLESLA